MALSCIRAIVTHSVYNNAASYGASARDRNVCRRRSSNKKQSRPSHPVESGLTSGAPCSARRHAKHVALIANKRIFPRPTRSGSPSWITKAANLITAKAQQRAAGLKEFNERPLRTHIASLEELHSAKDRDMRSLHALTQHMHARNTHIDFS